MRAQALRFRVKAGLGVLQRNRATNHESARCMYGGRRSEAANNQASEQAQRASSENRYPKLPGFDTEEHSQRTDRMGQASVHVMHATSGCRNEQWQRRGR